jgi:hypothetical protein
MCYTDQVAFLTNSCQIITVNVLKLHAKPSQT